MNVIWFLATILVLFGGLALAGHFDAVTFDEPEHRLAQQISLNESQASADHALYAQVQREHLGFLEAKQMRHTEALEALTSATTERLDKLEIVVDAVMQRTRTPQVQVVRETVVQEGRASYYGGHESLDYQPMAWGAIYDPNDPTIVAAPLRPGTTKPMWGEGTELVVFRRDRAHWVAFGLIGNAVRVWVRDTCPGCGVMWPAPWVDLSVAAYRMLGGTVHEGIVQVTIVEIR